MIFIFKVLSDLNAKSKQLNKKDFQRGEKKKKLSINDSEMAFVSPGVIIFCRLEFDLFIFRSQVKSVICILTSVSAASDLSEKTPFIPI